MQTPRRIRILIAEDDALLRHTLSELLGLDEEMNVVATAANGAQALADAQRLIPHVVLTDIEMPSMNGIELTRQLRELLPECAIVILTKFGDDESVFSALKAGALGYVLKDSQLDEIRAAVRHAHAGEGHLSPALVQRVLAEFSRVSHAMKQSRQALAELSRREIEVLELLANGLRNRAIADRLCLSEKTVKSHIGSILRKLHVNDRAEAAMLAQKHGLGDES